MAITRCEDNQWIQYTLGDEADCDVEEADQEVAHWPGARAAVLHAWLMLHNAQGDDNCPIGATIYGGMSPVFNRTETINGQRCNVFCAVEQQGNGFTIISEWAVRVGGVAAACCFCVLTPWPLCGSSTARRVRLFNLIPRTLLRVTADAR